MHARRVETTTTMMMMLVIGLKRFNLVRVHATTNVTARACQAALPLFENESLLLHLLILLRLSLNTLGLVSALWTLHGHTHTIWILPNMGQQERGCKWHSLESVRMCRLDCCNINGHNYSGHYHWHQVSPMEQRTKAIITNGLNIQMDELARS